MRILLLTPRLPWPPTDGGRVAMSRLASSLANGGAAIEILSLNPRKHRGEGSAPLPIHAVDVDTSRRLEPMLRALTSDVPYVVARFVSREFRDALTATLQRFAPDIVQIESPFLLPYAAQVRHESNTRVVLRSLNVEFRIWEGLARNEPHRLRRVALQRVATSLRRYELRQMNQLDAILPISASDAADFRSLGCAQPMHVVPCGVFVPEIASETPEPESVGFIGSLDFLPNQDAVKWILDELWPRVVERAPRARLSIAGSAPPQWLRERDVELHADIDDPYAFMQRMSVMIAPLFAGGGMRIKVLEAMALAKPVVATTIGAGGIDVHPDRDIVIADDVTSFAGGVVRLLHDRPLAARIGAAARANVAERYDSDAIARDLIRFYESR